MPIHELVSGKALEDNRCLPTTYLQMVSRKVKPPQGERRYRRCIPTLTAPMALITDKNRFQAARGFVKAKGLGKKGGRAPGREETTEGRGRVRAGLDPPSPRHGSPAPRWDT